jgi:hypothetical protein
MSSFNRQMFRRLVPPNANVEIESRSGGLINSVLESVGMLAVGGDVMTILPARPVK